jgi:hypothetical protein
MNNEHNPTEIQYGLIVVDPTQSGEMLDILHFVGYWNQPSAVDVESLRKELAEDAEFGLTEIAHRLEILPAPDYIVQDYIEIIKTNE